MKKLITPFIVLFFFFGSIIPYTIEAKPPVVSVVDVDLKGGLELLERDDVTILKKNGKHLLYQRDGDFEISLVHLFNQTNWPAIEASDAIIHRYRERIASQPDLIDEEERMLVESLVSKLGVEGLTVEEMTALRVYTSPSPNNYYIKINTLLREEILFDTIAEGPDDVEETLYHIYLVTSALNKLSKLEYEGVVYRAIHLSPNYLEQFKEGELFTEHAFSSTSKLVYNPNDLNVLLVIKGRSGRHIEDFSRAPGQKEVLFPPKTQFTVHKVIQQREGKTVVYLEEREASNGPGNQNL